MINQLQHTEAGKFEETRFEKIHNVIFDNSDHASIEVAKEIAGLIRLKEKEGKPCVRTCYRVFSDQSV